MNTPLMKYLNESIEQELGFSWEEYNALGIWEAGSSDIKTPHHNNM